MFEGVPEYVWAGGTIAVYAGLLMVPWLWMGLKGKRSTTRRASRSKDWDNFCISLAGALAAIGGMTLSLMLFPQTRESAGKLILGSVCFGPLVLVAAVAAWYWMWTGHRRKPRGEAAPPQHRQFSITQVMIGMVAMGVMMALVRAAYEFPQQGAGAVILATVLLAFTTFCGVVWYVVSGYDTPTFRRRERDVKLPSLKPPRDAADD